MQHNELMAALQNLIEREPKMYEIKRATGLKDTAIYNRRDRNSKYSIDEIIKIAKFYDVEVSRILPQCDIKSDNIPVNIPQPQKYEIKYCEELPEEYKNANLKSKWEDIETIENLWGRNKEDLRIIPMLGSSLEGYWYPIKNRDLLLIDTSITDLTKSGIFLFSTRNNSNLFIRELILQLDGSVLLRAYEPNGNREAKYTAEQLEELDFRVIGRVFKNINFTL